MERRQKWQILLADGLAEELARRREDLAPELERRLVHLEGCVAKLPGEQRTVVEGYYYRRLGIEALAKESGRTVEATYKKLQRIRSALRQCLENAVKLV
jgi:DNA-directed RNA polymerase specialized sigma24 family protein